MCKKNNLRGVTILGSFPTWLAVGAEGVAQLKGKIGFNHGQDPKFMFKKFLD